MVKGANFRIVCVTAPGLARQAGPLFTQGFLRILLLFWFKRCVVWNSQRELKS